MVMKEEMLFNIMHNKVYKLITLDQLDYFGWSFFILNNGIYVINNKILFMGFCS